MRADIEAIHGIILLGCYYARINLSFEIGVSSLIRFPL